MICKQEPCEVGPNWKGPIIELVVCTIVLSPSLLYPLARDQGLFSYAGQIILDGGQPYQDIYDQKGPATHYAFALIVAIFGPSTAGIRFAFLLVALGGAAAAAAIGERLGGRSARLPCALCYSLVTLQAHPMGPWMYGQVEDIVLPLMLCAILLLGTTKRVNQWKYNCAAAFLMGLAFAFKPTAVMPAVALAAISIGWVLMHRTGIGTAVGRAALSMFAFLTPLALFSGYLAAHGALDDLWMFVVEHNLTVYSKLQSGSIVDAVQILTTYFGGVALLALCGAGLGKRREPLLWTLMWTLIGSSLLMVVWQWKFFILYHWTVFAGALSIPAGLTICKLIQVVANVRPNLSRVRLTFAVCSAACLVVSANSVFHIEMMSRTAATFGGFQTIEQFRSPYRVGSSSAASTYEAADYIRGRTKSHETVLVWGYDVVINYLSDRRCPTRFAMNRVLQRSGSPHIEQWQQEFIRDITHREPSYILIADEYCATSFVGNPREHFQRFVAFREFVESKYQLETQIGSFYVYRLKSGRATDGAAA